jgi:hypothetical protein
MERIIMYRHVLYRPIRRGGAQRETCTVIPTAIRLDPRPLAGEDLVRSRMPPTCSASLGFNADAGSHPAVPACLKDHPLTGNWGGYPLPTAESHRCA